MRACAGATPKKIKKKKTETKMNRIDKLRGLKFDLDVVGIRGGVDMSCEQTDT